MNSKSALLKIMVAISFLSGVVGLGMAITPLKLIALIPSVLGVVFGIASYAIAKSKNGKLLFIYIALLIASAGTVTALVREFGMEDKVVVDKQFEEKTDQDATKVESENELDELQNELNDLE
jgi:hypothetical protein